jgi:hypothetical protein
MSSAAYSIAVVCEARADYETGCGLADRVLLAEIAWLESQMLDSQRRWRGFRPAETFLTWADAKNLARERGIRSHGFFDEEPAAHDFHAARRALLLLERCADSLDAVILLRDEDRDESRLHGLQQARTKSGMEEHIVIGVAHPKREAWVLAGFEPQDDCEREQLEMCRRDLGFDPRERAEELTAVSDDAKRSAKRVLKALTNGNPLREASCWQETSLDLLERRGRKNGLADYLEEVQRRLATLWTSDKS